jgi:alcohol dehydrogenase
MLPSLGRHQHAHGWLRHYAGMLTPDATSAMGLVFERDRGQRLLRSAAVLGDGARQRIRPSRSRMRALMASPGGKLDWRAVASPRPARPLEAVVHPIAVSTCDLDCPLVLGKTRLLLPLHLGHECVAEVLSVGSAVSTVKPGDRVIVPFQINCGACEACRSGRTGSCAGVPPVSMYGFGFGGGHWGGAFSDELAVPFADAMLVPLPEGIDPAAAVSVADNVCDAYRNVAPYLPAILETDPSAEVLILAGLSSRPMYSASCPLYAGLIARALGARNVCLVDSRQEVRARAERLGLRSLRPIKLRKSRRAPLVIHISGDPLATALSHTAPDGVCASSGGLHRKAKIPFLEMYVRNATLHVGRTHARALIPRVLELMVAGRLHPETVTTTVAPLDEAPSVLREHVFGGAIKTVLKA